MIEYVTHMKNTNYYVCVKPLRWLSYVIAKTYLQSKKHWYLGAGYSVYTFLFLYVTDLFINISVFIQSNSYTRVV